MSLYHFKFNTLREDDDFWVTFLCRTNIVEAHIQVRSLVKSEYSPEDIESIISMVSIEDLQAQLDSLL